MRNKKDQLFWGVILAIVAGTLFYSAVAYGQPPAIPANPPAVNVTPSATPQQTPATAATPAQQPQQINIPANVARAFKQAIDNLPPEDTNGWAAFLRGLAASYPTLALLIGMRGLFGIIGLPIHTWLDRYLQKHLSAQKYAAVHTEGSTIFKQIDWLVNFVFSIKPSTVMAASGITKVSVVPEPAQK